MPNRFSVKVPDVVGATRRQIARDLAQQNRAARIAADRTATTARDLMRADMTAAGLGKLTNAVKATSALKRGVAGAWGAVFAAGGDDSLAGGALDAYSNGVTIQAKDRTWLAFATSVIPKYVGNHQRMTPALYVSLGFDQRIGKLHFQPTRSGSVALLVARNVAQHVRTGRIKARGVRKSKVNVDAASVVVFILIRFTTRAQRFDKLKSAQAAIDLMPGYIAEILDAS